MKRIVLLTALLSLLCTSLPAQENEVLGLGRIDRDPALAGSAGAALASPEGIAWQAFHTAAGIPFSKSFFEGAASYQNWSPKLAKASHVNLCLGFNFNEFVGFAAGLAYQSGASFEVAGSGFTPKDLLVSAGVGIRPLNWLSLGVNFRYLQQSLAPNYQQDGFSADFSALVRPLENLHLMLGFCALGTSVKDSMGQEYRQPACAQAGLGYLLPLGDFSLRSDASGEYYLSGNYAAAAGLQFDWSKILFARTGYRWASEKCVLPTHLALGLGVRVEGIRLDITYLTASKALANTLCLGLGYSF